MDSVPWSRWEEAPWMGMSRNLFLSSLLPFSGMPFCCRSRPACSPGGRTSTPSSVEREDPLSAMWSRCLLFLLPCPAVYPWILTLILWVGLHLLLFLVSWGSFCWGKSTSCTSASSDIHKVLVGKAVGYEAMASTTVFFGPSNYICFHPGPIIWQAQIAAWIGSG